MFDAADVIRYEVTLEVLGPDEPVPAEAELRYDPTDPYAVEVGIRQIGPEVVWTFGRDLLIRGVSEPAGYGDVHVFPSLDPEGHAVVALTLRSPGGEALLTVRTGDVLAFLARTTRAVWPGTESDHLSADDAIAAILT